MPNMIPNGNFAAAAQIVASGSTVQYVGGDPTQGHVIQPAATGNTYFRWLFGYMKPGTELEFQVTGKKVSGDPRVMIHAYDSAGANTQFEDAYYVPIDSEDDWKRYRIRYRVAHPDVVRMTISLGFLSTLTGEAYFKDPYMRIVDEYADAKFYAPRTLAIGIVGWDNSETAWEIKAPPAGPVSHGIDSLSWDGTGKVLTVNFTHAPGATISSSLIPLTQVSMHSNGAAALPGVLGIIPVVKSTDHEKAEIFFVDKDNNLLDIEAIGGDVYVTVETKV